MTIAAIDSGTQLADVAFICGIDVINEWVIFFMWR